MIFSPLVDELIEALRCLPGVGPKSAQRMALHLLERNAQGGLQLADTLQRALTRVGHCQRCRTLTEQTLCAICSNPRRDDRTLCVVETPADMLAVEQTGGYRGQYFVLLGHLSPIDGIGPEEIGIDLLLERVRKERPEEVVLATNPTVEGEATAHYIAEQLQDLDLQVSRLAHGIPLGGELEYVDGGTLSHAFAGRRSMRAGS